MWILIFITACIFSGIDCGKHVNHHCTLCRRLSLAATQVAYNCVFIFFLILYLTVMLFWRFWTAWIMYSPFFFNHVHRASILARPICTKWAISCVKLWELCSTTAGNWNWCFRATLRQHWPTSCLTSIIANDLVAYQISILESSKFLLSMSQTLLFVPIGCISFSHISLCWWKPHYASLCHRSRRLSVSNSQKCI